MATITSKDRTVRYSELPNLLVNAANGVDYAYRDTGPRDAACRSSCCSTSAETSTTGTLR